MKILVPVKRVVDYNIKIRIKTDGSGVELANVKRQKFGGARFRI
jgi:electron transfer flavoprotein alpha/beta subunit